MNDLEQQVKRLLDDDATRAPLVAHVPPHLRAGIRRRQARTVGLGSLATVLALTMAFVALQSVADRGSTPATTPASSLRTSRIQNYTVTAPTFWTLADMWAAQPFIAASQGPHHAGQAVFLLTDAADAADAAISGQSFCSGTSTVPANAVRLYVGAEDAGTTGFPPEIGVGAWPAPLIDAAAGPCGPGSYARWMMHGAPYFAYLGVGSEASATSVAQARTTFEGLTFVDAAPVDMRAIEPAIGVVVASGTSEGSTWNLELRRRTSTTIDQLAVIDSATYEVIDAIVAQPGQPYPDPRPLAVGQAVNGVSYGFARSDAAMVELRDGAGRALGFASLVTPKAFPALEARVFWSQAPPPSVGELTFVALNSNGDPLIGGSVSSISGDMFATGEIYGNRWAMASHLEGRRRCFTTSLHGGMYCLDPGRISTPRITSFGTVPGTADIPAYSAVVAIVPPDVKLIVVATPQGEFSRITSPSPNGFGELRRAGLVFPGTIRDSTIRFLGKDGLPRYPDENL